MTPIPLGNSWEYIWPGIRKNAGTGAVEPVTGLTGLEAWLSEDEDGETIHDDLTKTLTERTELPGEYFAVVPKAAIDTHLAAFEGEVIYEVLQDGNTRMSAPRIVARTRTT